MKPTYCLLALLGGLLAVLGACSAPPPDQNTVTEQTAAAPARIVLYYFHRTLRCDECLSMELFADTLIQTTFAQEVAVGTLVYDAVNLDEDGNESYVDQFGLTFSTLVLVSEDDAGNMLEWRELDEAWDKALDMDGFKAYVSEAVTAWLQDLQTASG